MKNINILPADTYTVLNKTIISDIDLKIISILYQPIIGFTAVSLYNTLIYVIQLIFYNLKFQLMIIKFFLLNILVYLK